MCGQVFLTILKQHLQHIIMIVEIKNPGLLENLACPVSPEYLPFRLTLPVYGRDLPLQTLLLSLQPRHPRFQGLEAVNEIKYHSSHNIVYSCKYHIVFCPKYRRKVLVNGVDTRLKELVKSICEEIQVDVIEMEIMPDHVHLLLEVHPQFGVHKAVKTIKGKTSRILRQEFPWLTTKLPSLWTNSYFCSTVGGAPLNIVKQYIENQKTSQRK